MSGADQKNQPLLPALRAGTPPSFWGTEVRTNGRMELALLLIQNTQLTHLLRPAPPSDLHLQKAAIVLCSAAVITASTSERVVFKAMVDSVDPRFRCV